MKLSARRRRNVPAGWVAGTLLAAASMLSGCGGSTPAGGDPGGRRLKELSSDTVFAAVPDGATGIERTRHGARYRKPGFSGGGWDGPTVIITFKSALSPPDVYRFYARHAEAAGWTPTAAGALGLDDRWAKTFADGAPATLMLALLSRASSMYVYRLSGGVAPVTRS